MEFADLSKYEYFRSPLPMRSLGWLGREEGVQGGGEPPMNALDLRRIQAASSRLSNLTLGFHECDFCPEEAAFRGNGEYHYYLSNGDVYAAPALILHYLEEHGYRLPTEFRRGLHATTELAWDGRAELLCDILADRSEDDDSRCLAVTDLENWRSPPALEALVRAIRDEDLVEIIGHEIGRSLVPYLDCDFASDLIPADLPDIVKYGMQ
jgi:hypothetical protein